MMGNVSIPSRAEDRELPGDAHHAFLSILLEIAAHLMRLRGSVDPADEPAVTALLARAIFFAEALAAAQHWGDLITAYQTYFDPLDRGIAALPARTLDHPDGIQLTRAMDTAWRNGIWKELLYHVGEA